MSKLGFDRARGGTELKSDAGAMIDSLASMKPQPVEEDWQAERKSLEASASQTDTIRQSPPAPDLYRKARRKGPTVPVSMRMRVDSRTRFVKLSEHLHLPYDETVEWLMDRIRIDADGNLPGQ